MILLVDQSTDYLSLEFILSLTIFVVATDLNAKKVFKVLVSEQFMLIGCKYLSFL